MEPDTDRQQRRAVYWTRAVRLTRLLLALWFAVTFVTVFFARDLAGLSLFGWPLSYYMAAQGIVLVYLLLVGAYAWSMNRLDRLLDGGAPPEDRSTSFR